MALRSHVWRSSCNNLPADLIGEQDEFAGSQSLAGRSDANNNQALIPPKAPTPPEAPTLPLIPPSKDLFTKFMETFVELTQAWDREQVELRKQPFKTRSLETYLKKSYMDCYHFC